MARDRSKWICVASYFMIISGLTLNPWLLHSLLLLHDGQRGLLRLGCVWLFDISAVVLGLVIWIRRNKITLRPRAILFAGLAFVLTILGLELTLKLSVRISPGVDRMLSRTRLPQAFPNPQYGSIPNPRFPGHDANGFRNRRALMKANVVTIGDSFTYGTWVRLPQTWPFQLQRISGRLVYNMSFGGYGGIEGLMLMERAMDLKPSVVVCTLYDGNDLYDAYRAVYGRNQFPEFKTTDSVVQKAILDHEQLEPLEQYVKRAWSAMYTPQPSSSSTKSSSHVKANTPWTSIKRLELFRLFFALETAAQTTFADTHAFRSRNERRIAQTHPEMFEVFDAGGFTTIFTPAYRFAAVNLEDPRIREGLRLSHLAIMEMSRIARSHGVRLLVLLIPTKERVFYEIYPQTHQEASKSMAWLLRQEEEIRRQTKDFLSESNISYVDLLPILSSCFEEGNQPYFVDSDGHFNPIGHAAVAEAIHRYLKDWKPMAEKNDDIHTSTIGN